MIQPTEAKILISLLLELRKDVDQKLAYSQPGQRVAFTPIMSVTMAVHYNQMLSNHRELLDRLKAEYDL